MEKQIIDVVINPNLEWGYGIELQKLKKDIELLEQLGVTHVEISADDYYGCATLEIKAICRRLETDEEYDQRIIKERDELLKRERYELELFEKLKKKYL